MSEHVESICESFGFVVMMVYCRKVSPATDQMNSSGEARSKDHQSRECDMPPSRPQTRYKEAGFPPTSFCRAAAMRSPSVSLPARWSALQAKLISLSSRPVLTDRPFEYSIPAGGLDVGWTSPDGRANTSCTPPVGGRAKVWRP